MSKQDLCKQFVHGTYSEDDEFEIVETLVDLRADECSCVFAKEPKPQCKKMSTTPFGLCNAHLKTKIGTNLAIKWNKLLEDLEIEESEEDEGQGQEGQGEKTVTFATADDVIELVEPPQPPAPVEPVQPPAPVEPIVDVKKEAVALKKEPVTTKKEAVALKKEPVATKKEAVALKKEVAAKKDQEKSESDSGVARYVAQNSEDEVPSGADEEEEQVKPVKPKMRFERNNYGNYINKETKLVIRQRDKVVLGTETATGTINHLTDEEIEFCKENNLNYIAKE